jgi:hypothetical protein
MLLLLQSYITFQQFPRGGGEVITTPAAVIDDTLIDDELLSAWFAWLARIYDKN